MVMKNWYNLGVAIYGKCVEHSIENVYFVSGLKYGYEICNKSVIRVMKSDFYLKSTLLLICQQMR